MSSKLNWGVRLFRQNARRFTTSEKRLITKEEVEKMKKIQELYQTESKQNKPVYMIAGGKIHFYITSALGVLTVIFTADSLYKIVKSRP